MLLGTAVAELARVQANADAQMNAEIAQNNAQSALTIAADQAAHDQTVAGAQAEDALATAQAGALATQAASNAYFATLPDLLTAPAADTPITLTGNYGHMHDIGGHSVGNTADTIDAVMGLMFSTQPDSEPSAGTGAGAWAGMGGWSGSWLCGGVGGQFGSALLGYLAIPSDPPPRIMLPGLGSTGSGIAGATWTNPAQTGGGGSVFGAGPGIYAQTPGGGGVGSSGAGTTASTPPAASGAADPGAALNRQARLEGDTEATNKVPRALSNAEIQDLQTIYGVADDELDQFLAENGFERAGPCAPAPNPLANHPHFVADPDSPGGGCIACVPLYQGGRVVGSMGTVGPAPVVPWTVIVAILQEIGNNQNDLAEVLMEHYEGGTGSTYTLSQQEMENVRPANPSPTQSSEFQDALQQAAQEAAESGHAVVVPIDVTVQTQAAEGMTLGTFVIHHTGTLVVNADGTWSYIGTMTFSDTFDFENHPDEGWSGRNAQAGAVAATCDGVPFEVESVGAPFEESSDIPAPTQTPPIYE